MLGGLQSLDCYSLCELSFLDSWDHTGANDPNPVYWRMKCYLEEIHTAPANGQLQLPDSFWDLHGSSRSTQAIRWLQPHKHSQGRKAQKTEQVATHKITENSKSPLCH